MEQNKKVIKSMATKVLDLDEKGQVKIYFSKFNTVDGQNQISDSASFNKTIEDGYKRVKHLHNHDPRRLLGLPKEIISDSFGAMAVSAMNINKPFVKDVYEDYRFFQKHGKSMEHSFVGYIVKSVFDKAQNAVRNLEYRLLEYSTIDFLGAEGDTPLVAIKGLNLEDENAALNDMLNGKYTLKRLTNIENQIKMVQKAMEGAAIVKCPSCSLKFDYNDQPEQTIEARLRENLVRYTNYKIEDEAFKAVREMSPEIQSQIVEIMGAKKVSKGLTTESFYTHVRCPKCYGIVSKQSLAASEPTEVTPDSKPMVTKSLIDNFKL